jgi:hypothetical protein
MKRTFLLALISGVLTLASSRAVAQSTNVVQHAYFVLKGLKQRPTGGVSAVRVSNKDILAALNASGNYNFSPGAVLLFVRTDDQSPSIVVREVNKDQVTDTDVGNYFGIKELGDEVHSQDDLTRWGTWSFAFDNGQETDFELRGFTTFFRRPPSSAGISTPMTLYAEQSGVNGVGGLGGVAVVFYGNVYGGNPSLEVE